MNNPDPQIPVPVFRGAEQNASYKEQLVGRYKGNPLIESLPDILSAENAAGLMAYYPERDSQGYKLDPEIRMHLVMDALHFFEPLPVHIDLEQRISRVLRDGYFGRNPVAKDYWHEIDQRVETILKVGGIPLRSSSVNGFSIIGLPGTGKTTGIERILQLCPQIIHHQTYHGKPFSRIQVVWLKLTCPHDGSIKALCLDFFREMDNLLRTDYYHTHAGDGRRTVDELIPAMARVSWIHCLGVLVIDEIQHLNQAKSGGAERMLNFFLQLMNTLGLPVLLIGTYAALQILSRELRQIRRSSGQGDLIWDRMANDGVWHLFIESLWRYRYTKFPVPLTQELIDVLYEESAGIVDFAAKIFLLAQIRVIANNTEKITAAAIRSVAHDSLRMAQPVLRALRTGDMRAEAVARMTDLHPIDFQSAVQQIRKAALLQDLSRASRAVSDLSAAAAAPPASDSDAADGTTAEPIRRTPLPPAQPPVKPRRSRNQASPSKCLLVQLADAGVSKGISPHTALLQAGFVGPIFEFKGSHATP